MSYYEKYKVEDAVWHDVWDELCTDNLPQMHRLHRRSDWRGSRSRSFLEYRVKQEKKRRDRWRW